MNKRCFDHQVQGSRLLTFFGSELGGAAVWVRLRLSLRLRSLKYLKYLATGIPVEGQTETFAPVRMVQWFDRETGLVAHGRGKRVVSLSVQGKRDAAEAGRCWSGCGLVKGSGSGCVRERLKAVSTCSKADSQAFPLPTSLFPSTLPIRGFLQACPCADNYPRGRIPGSTFGDNGPCSCERRRKTPSRDPFDAGEAHAPVRWWCR